MNLVILKKIKESNTMSSSSAVAFASVCPRSRLYVKEEVKLKRSASGILLFDKDGKVLLNRRYHSYGFDSMMQLSTFTRPETVRSYINECTEEEFKILKESWHAEGFKILRKAYLNFYPEQMRYKAKLKLRQNSDQIWAKIVSLVDISTIEFPQNPRIYDIPKTKNVSQKDRDSIVKTNLVKMLGRSLPESTAYHIWINIEYVSSDSVTYVYHLLLARTDSFEIPANSTVEWVDIDQLDTADKHLVPEMVSAIQKAADILND